MKQSDKTAIFTCNNKLLYKFFNKYFRSKYSKQDTEWGFFAKYKFYFAFENSIHCNDYLSEKFWRNSLAQGLVPVVYGPHPDDVKVIFIKFYSESYLILHEKVGLGKTGA